MWRADSYDDHEIDEPATVNGGPQPSSISVGDPRVLPMNVAAPTWERWRADLAALGGRSTLLHFEDDPRGRIELGTSHPGGLARFIAGSPTLLSNLVRDDVALRSARIAAERIVDKGLELSTI